MTTVALVGADGAGKSAVARLVVARLEAEGRDARYLHMGENPDAGPLHSRVARCIWWLRRRRGRTPRGGPPPVGATARATTMIGKLRGKLSGLGQLTVMVSEERARQAASRRWAAGGTIVIWDRDFLADNYARDIRCGQRSVGQRLHGAYLTHRYRRPDLMIVLDAPPSVLFARQGEGTLPDLAARRQEYLDLAGSSGDAIVVDADSAVGDVVDAVMDLVVAHVSRLTTDEAPVSSHS